MALQSYTIMEIQKHSSKWLIGQRRNHNRNLKILIIEQLKYDKLQFVECN